MADSLEAVIGTCRNCGCLLDGENLLLCGGLTCRVTKTGLESRRSRATRVEEADPYKKVWNTTEDEEGALLDSVRNGTLFAPTYGEMARRHLHTAQFLERKARKLDSVEAADVLLEAEFHRRMANRMDELQQDLLFKVQPKLLHFSVVAPVGAQKGLA